MIIRKKIIIVATVGILCSLFIFMAASPEKRIVVGDELIQKSFFNSTALISYKKVDCTLEDGSRVDCYELVFNSNPVNQGPYCPEKIDEAVSLTIYDGPHNPGFQLVTRALFEAMEADGFDIVEDDGEVHGFDSEQRSDWDYCLGPKAPPRDIGLELTFLIPAIPIMTETISVVSTTDFDLVGLTLDGIPIAGDPPSIFDGPGRGIPGGNIPALDPCGGHPDPAGYYHLHFIPETINKVLDANGITEVACTNISQASGTQIIGFAKDGFPIYAYDEEPLDLDECRGRNASTPEFPNGTYHYVASNKLTPNAPDCIKGLAVKRGFSF